MLVKYIKKENCIVLFFYVKSTNYAPMIYLLPGMYDSNLHVR